MLACTYEYYCCIKQSSVIVKRINYTQYNYRRSKLIKLEKL